MREEASTTRWPQQRLAEIQSMLLKREDRGEIEEWIRQAAQELGNDGEAAVANWRKWSDQEGELWSYGSGPKSWDRLAGECGWAIVQQGKVVDFQILAVN